MVSEEAQAAWRTIPASTWSDALDHFRIAGVISGLVWRSGTPPLAGRAVTVREEVGPLGSVPVSAFDVGAILDAGHAGDVLVIDMGGAEVSTCGGLAAHAAVSRRVAGMLIDGGCRDLADIRATGLKLAACHVTPTSGKERARLISINEPITCGGAAVSPGDYIIADETGAVVIPAARFDEIADVALDFQRRDHAFERALGDGKPFGEITAALRHL